MIYTVSLSIIHGLANEQRERRALTGFSGRAAAFKVSLVSFFHICQLRELNDFRTRKNVNKIKP